MMAIVEYGNKENIGLDFVSANGIGLFKRLERKYQL